VSRALLGNLDPARVTLARDLYAHERMESLMVDTVIAMADHRAVDILRDNEDQRIGHLPERPFDPGRIEQAERDIQCLAKASIGIVVDFSCVQDDPDPQLPLRLAATRKGGVVFGKEPAEEGDRTVQQERLGHLVNRMEKAEPSLIDLAPSVAHTARAVRVLAVMQTMRPSGPVLAALEQAVAWLIEQRDLHNAYEVIERPVTGRPELVHVRHFTAALVVKALVSAGVPAAHPSVSSAVAQIWSSYGGDTAALWAWDNGDLPIWMTFDAIDALRLANLAVPARPSWSPPT